MLLHHSYTSGRLENWYEQNYDYMHALWPTWLSDSLKQMMTQNHQYKILSPSANKGWHERDAWKQLMWQGYETAWVVSDLCGYDLYEQEKDHHSFIHIKQNVQAQELDFDDTFDFILDNKGALWHTLRKWNCRKEVLSLLSHYEQLLKDNDSCLFIDGYDHIQISYWKNLFRFRQRKKEMDEFYENSTLHEWQTSMRGLNDCFHPIQTDLLDEETVECIQKMNLVYITKAEIRKLCDQ